MLTPVRRRQLRSLADGIGELRALTLLDCDANLLSALPDGLSRLAALTSLSARRNRLTPFPAVVCALPLLRVPSRVLTHTH
jgi:Leucine-rich repeat (LRR) protein